MPQGLLPGVDYNYRVLTTTRYERSGTESSITAGTWGLAFHLCVLHANPLLLPTYLPPAINHAVKLTEACLCALRFCSYSYGYACDLRGFRWYGTGG